MENKKGSLSTVFLVIAIILILAMGALLYMQKTEADRQIAELENNASEMQEIINNLQGKIDSISNTINNNETNKENDKNNTNWKAAYINKLNSSQTSDEYKEEYYLTDIDGNGIPELMLEKYTCEADRGIQVYTYNKDSIVYLGDFGSSQMEFYKMNNKDYLLGVYGHMRYEETYKIYINNNSIIKENLGNEREISLDEGYTEGDILLEKANFNQLYLIENYN